MTGYYVCSKSIYSELAVQVDTAQLAPHNTEHIADMKSYEASSKYISHDTGLMSPTRVKMMTGL
jgi:hypothetical protein